MRRRSIPLVLSVLLSFAGGTSAFADTTSTTSPVTSTIKNPPRVVRTAPLTGLPDPTAVSKRRSALTIKVENTPEARPQYGIEQADVIYEEIVEGGITRLAAIFNSRLPIKVGPVRSVRRTDREIVYPIGGLFAFSGGAQYAINSIATAPVKLFDESNSGSAMFRDPTRYAPHNLYADPVRLMSMGGVARPPRPLFQFAPVGTRALGAPVGSFTVNFPAGYATSYQWNPATKSWPRSIFGRPDVTASRVQMSPTNVIVMSVNYEGGVGRIGAEAVLTGSGSVDVFSDGRVQKGKWFRSKLGLPTAYRTASGKVIELHPGQTLVELLATGETVSAYAPKHP